MIDRLWTTTAFIQKKKRQEYVQAAAVKNWRFVDNDEDGFYLEKEGTDCRYRIYVIYHEVVSQISETHLRELIDGTSKCTHLALRWQSNETDIVTIEISVAGELHITTSRRTHSLEQLEDMMNAVKYAKEKQERLKTQGWTE